MLDLVAEFKADCLGWQYQLGPDPPAPAVAISPKACSTPPAGPKATATLIASATEADQGNVVPMELHEAPAQAPRVCTKP